MTSIEESRQQLEQAKQSAQEQRQLIEQQRQEAQTYEESIQESKELLAKQKSKIPLPSQRLLRQGMFAGLEGRKRRQQVEMIKKGVSAKEGELKGEETKVGIFKGELTKFEKEQIEPFELELSQRELEIEEYERQQKEYERQQASLKLAERVYSGSAPVLALHYDQLAKHYYNLLLQGEKAEIKRLASLSEKSLTTPPLSSFINPKGTYDVKTKTYISPEGYKQSMSLSSAQKIGATIFTLPTSLVLPKISPTRELSRTDIQKDFSQLKSVDFTKLTQPKNIFDVPFRTTGSPIRITKLTSPKSRGYNETRHQVKQPAKIKPILNIQKPKKIINKDLFGLSKDFLSSKKKKKKKTSIWGF